MLEIKQRFKMKTLRTAFLSIFCLLFLFSFSYYYPRFLSSQLGEDSIWISYLYTYGLGSLFFILSAVWIFTRANVNPERKKQEIQWLIAISCSLTFMFIVHGLWIFLAGEFPIKN